MGTVLDITWLQFKYRQAHAYWRMKVGKCDYIDVAKQFNVSTFITSRWVARFEDEYKKELDARRRKQREI